MSRAPITLEEILDFGEWLDTLRRDVHRCPECGSWFGRPYTCTTCGVDSITQGEYLTRLACGPQPARLPGSAT